MIEVLKGLFAMIGIMIAFIIIIILLVILIATAEAIFNSYKKNKNAKHYMKDAKKIIEREKDEVQE